MSYWVAFGIGVGVGAVAAVVRRAIAFPPLRLPKSWLRLTISAALTFLSGAVVGALLAGNFVGGLLVWLGSLVGGLVAIYLPEYVTEDERAYRAASEQLHAARRAGDKETVTGFVDSEYASLRSYAVVIIGRRDLVARAAKHPLKRVLRLDKIRLAALEATLRLYRNPDRVAELIPTLRLLARPAAAIRALAESLAAPLAAWAGPEWRVAVEACRSQIGSGALPTDTLPSAGLALHPTGRTSGRALDAMAARLRGLSPPIIGATRDDAVRLDLRCLEESAPFLAAIAPT